MPCILRGDLVLCHVTGAQKYHLLCFAVGRLVKRQKLKLKDFGRYAKEKMMPEV